MCQNILLSWRNSLFFRKYGLPAEKQGIKISEKQKPKTNISLIWINYDHKFGKEINLKKSHFIIYLYISLGQSFLSFEVHINRVRLFLNEVWGEPKILHIRLIPRLPGCCWHTDQTLSNEDIENFQWIILLDYISRWVEIRFMNYPWFLIYSFAKFNNMLEF